jgi:hypothetical protein
MGVPPHEWRIYLSAYKRFAVMTVVVRHTSDNRILPTLYRSGTWMDGTPLTDEENAAAKRRFAELEALRKPAPRPLPDSDEDPSENWPEAPPW